MAGSVDQLNALLPEKITKICCIGAGYVGGPTCTVLAQQCPDLVVTIVDVNSQRIAAWNSEDLSELPVFEPGLSSIVGECRGRNLFFTTEIDRAIDEAQIVFVSVNTPTKISGIGSGFAADLRYVEASTRRIASIASTPKIIVEKSTVPCRTAATMRAILEANSKPGISFQILSNPEFLSEGTAVQDLLNPDRVLIGSLATEQGNRAAELLSEVYERWVPKDRVLRTGLWSSELTKLVRDCLADERQRMLCLRSGFLPSMPSRQFARQPVRMSMKSLMRAVWIDGLDLISCAQVSASAEAASKKDILNLVYLSGSLNLPEVAEYWRQVIVMNEFSKARFAKKVVQTLFNTVTAKRLALLGFAFKKDTGDTRESPAITLCQHFREEGAQIAIYDPKVPRSQILLDLTEPGVADDRKKLEESITICSSIQEACRDAEAVVIATDWDEFRAIDWHDMYRIMRKPAVVFDGRRVVEPRHLREIGFRVHAVGIGPELQDNVWV